MIFNNLNNLKSKLKNKKIFFCTSDNKLLSKWEDLLLFFLQFFKIDIIKITSSDLNKIKDDDNLLTIDPNIYYQKVSKFAVLYVISIDNEYSNLMIFSNYVKINKLKNEKDFIFNQSFFLNVLSKIYPVRKIESKIKFYLSFFNLIPRKKYLLKNFYIPYFYYSKFANNGNYIGLSWYNLFIPPNKTFKDDFKFIKKKLHDLRSKNEYSLVINGGPSDIWKLFFDNLLENSQYQDYLNYDNYPTVINLGVFTGAEIPFFLSKNINSIINVDPTGEEMLDPYTKVFVNFFRDKCIFMKKYLYSDAHIYNKLLPDNYKEIIDYEYTDEDFPSTNLFEIFEGLKDDQKNNCIIKSDIEGLEYDMLSELPKIIEKYRPQLAISIYHIDTRLYPINSHLTLIPKKIIESCENYNFMVKHYSNNRRETIFYAIPK
jgi:hypothetical protein